MTVRAANADDLPRLEACFRDFSTVSRFFRRYSFERFIAAWTVFISSNTGAIFLMEHDGAVVGALGGVIYPDIYSGEAIATEFFWFVQEKHRGRGLLLYREFEAWARRNGCAEMRMVHMLDSMPESLNKVYTRLGYTPAEVHYVKEIF